MKEQYEKINEEVNKCKNERMKLLERNQDLSTIRVKLEEKEKEYEGYKRSISSMYDIDINQCSASELFDRAILGYAFHMHEDAVSPLILSASNKLANRADELKNFFDKKIAEMHEQLKIAGEYLDLEDFDSLFFLRSQRSKTDFYDLPENKDLVHLEQTGRWCWFTALAMAAADRDKDFLNSEKEAKLWHAGEHWDLIYGDRLGQKSIKSTLLRNEQLSPAPIVYSILLKAINHPIPYKYVREENMIQQKLPGILFDDSPFESEYASQMGHLPQI